MNSGLSVYKPLLVDDIKTIQDRLKRKVASRAKEFYIYGSVARGDFSAGSDIDMIIVKETHEKFVKRAVEFEDLFEIYPRLDVLVYTPDEFQRLKNSDSGFWKKFRKESVRLI